MNTRDKLLKLFNTVNLQVELVMQKVNMSDELSPYDYERIEKEYSKLRDALKLLEESLLDL